MLLRALIDIKKEKMSLINLIKYFSIFCLITMIFLTTRANSAHINEQALAALKGKVVTINQEPILEAEIQLKHKETGQIFHSKSNKKGCFSSRFLPPGNYIITITKKGYKSYTGELELLPNTTRNIEITLAKEETAEQKLKKEAISSFEKGVKLAEENKLDEAIQAFQRAVELKQDFAEAYLNLGILLFRRQKDDEAEIALLKALELKPEESMSKEVLAEINYEKAKSLVQANKMDEALEKLKMAYSYNADHSYVNYLLGYIYYKKEMKNEAVKHLEAFLQFEPNAPQVEKVKELLERLKRNNKH